MTREQWVQWQHFVAWADLDRDEVHALLVFLAIRGLGKVRTFAKALPKDSQSAERVVLYLMDRVPSFVPSVEGLSPKMRALVARALETHSRFNLAQMLQGENTPSQVYLLQRFIMDEGGALLKFYLFGAAAPAGAAQDGFAEVACRDHSRRGSCHALWQHSEPEVDMFAAVHRSVLNDLAASKSRVFLLGYAQACRRGTTICRTA